MRRIDPSPPEGGNTAGNDLGSPLVGLPGGGQGGGGQGGSGGAGRVLGALIGAPAGKGGTGTSAGTAGGSGLNGLIDLLTASGLADKARSWTGTGAGKPVDGARIAEALPDDTPRKVAADAGVTPEQAAGRIADSLPTAVDRLTPGGRVPQESPEEIIGAQHA